jgi:YidC/Oxa1 family membrane protein insertase
MWAGFVDLIRATIFAGSHLLNGSLGASIIVVSTIVRLALLPLMLRTARQAREQQRRLAEIKPQLERLKKRYESDPVQLMTRTKALYRENDIQLLPGSSMVSAAIQLPLFGGLFAAVREGLGARVRFLWIADISRVDALLITMVVGLTGFATAMTPAAPGSPVGSRMLAVMIMGATLVFLWSASSAVALSVGAGSAVSVLQSWLLRREAVRAT